MSIEHNELQFAEHAPKSYTDLLLEQRPDLRVKKVDIDSTEPFDKESPTTILLPGFVISPDLVFRKQEEQLRGLGQNVATVTYAEHGFSQDLLQAQVYDYMSSLSPDQKVNFVGMSIGARAVVGVLSEMPDELQKRVNGAVLLGLVYSDLDLKNDFFGRASHIANRITPDQVVTRMSGLIKKHIKIDPMYSSDTDDEKLVRKQVSDLSSHVIVDMFSELSKGKPVVDIEPLNHGIKAGIGWWEDDHASLSARNRASNLFAESFEFSISGHHGWTETGAEDINSAIAKALQ